MPENEAVDYSTSFVEFTVNGKTRRQAFDENRKNKDGTLYGFTCPVNSVQMADEITAVYHYFTKEGKEKTVAGTYSVITYGDDFFRHLRDFGGKLQKLVEALTDYGFYAQLYLSSLRGWSLGTDHAQISYCYTGEYTDEMISDAKTALAEKAVSVNKGSDIAKVSYSLNLDAETAIFLYFKPAEGYSGSASATVDGKDAAVEKLSDGRYRVAIRDILAHRLSDMANVILTTDNGSTAVTVSAMSYIKACLDSPTDTEETNAMMALYSYSESAAAYIN